ncbi:MAG: hypothetical protein ACE5GA_09935, partial [Candidatus Zixiibacteriota bacterium]
MRALFVTHNYPRHSEDYSGVFLRYLAHLLAEEGVRVSVLAPHDRGAAESESSDGIAVRRFRYGSDENETFAYRGDMHRRIMTPAGLIQFRHFQ